jgi:Cu+-exporting ATPase
MADTVKDPICGMLIDPATAAGSSEYAGQTYYFCGMGCKKEFDADPAKYAGGESDEATHDHGHHH